MLKVTAATVALICIAGCGKRDPQTGRRSMDPVGDWMGASAPQGWLIVQHASDGGLAHCWKVAGGMVPESNKYNWNGLEWRSTTGATIRISGGLINFAEVKGADWSRAAQDLDVGLDRCREMSPTSRPNEPTR
jgi:hypothetical protein